MKKIVCIRDCWWEVKQCETIEELENTIANLPRWSGDWDIEKINKDEVKVTNTFYDENSNESIISEEILDINTKYFFK